MKIDAYTVIKIHDESPRHHIKCDDCGKRRQCTQLTLKSKITKRIIIEYLCNECLTKTPSWES